VEESLSGEQVELLDPSVSEERKRQIRRRRILRWWGGTAVLFVAVVLLFPLTSIVTYVYGHIWNAIGWLFGQ